jgi:hypothetical protein
VPLALGLGPNVLRFLAGAGNKLAELMAGSPGESSHLLSCAVQHLFGALCRRTRRLALGGGGAGGHLLARRAQSLPKAVYKTLCALGR